LDYAVKPVYSEEEMEEIITSEFEAEEDWKDEVDYDEYDDYYDFEE